MDPNVQAISTDSNLPEMSAAELERYAWQMWMPGVGETGQRRLKAATVLISRVGGLGGVVAQELAAAGVGRLILAHAGDLQPSDLNRQILHSTGRVGQPRMPGIVQRLTDLNPHVELVGLEANMTPELADKWVPEADIIVDAAPMFEERLSMNDAARRHRRPMVECSMFEMKACVTTFVPGKTGCLRCYVPTVPASWKRQFPVFGAVSGAAGCVGAAEVIKWITGIGQLLAGELWEMDMATMHVRRVQLPRRADCPACQCK